MKSRELPTTASVRSVREEIARNEAYLRGEHRGYANARDRAMTALNLAGGDPGVSAEDHAMMTELRGALLVSEIGRTKDPKAKRALAEQLRSLADQVEDARFDIVGAAKEHIVSANEEIVTVELMLLELREERRRYIEELRQAIDVTNDPALMLECCALIEEDIHASLAAGDLDGVRRSTASLAAVRALLPRPNEEFADGEDSDDELAHTLAATVIGDRDSGVVAGDALWFERAIARNLSTLSGPNREQSAVKKALLEYRAANERGKVKMIADIDPKAAFVDGTR